MKKAVIILTMLTGLLFPPTVGTATWEYSDAAGFKSYGERLEFKRLLGKHGLHKQISIVCGWYEGDPTFIDKKGRRCAFR